MGIPFVNVLDKSVLDCTQAYHEKSRGFVHVRGAPVNQPGFTEQITGIDASVQTHGCTIPWAFFYPLRLDTGHLKHSLAEVLSLHPCVAGRIQPVSGQTLKDDKYKRRFKIEYNNAGVEFVEGYANVELASIKHPVLGRKTVYALDDKLPPYFEGIHWQQMMNGKEPLMKVKITYTADGGSILAVCLSHVIADGKSFTSLMQSWAAEYRNIKETSAPKPFHNRLVLQPSTIEASLLALERHETNPFAQKSDTASIRQQESSLAVQKHSEMDVSAALRDMNCEYFEDMPGCISSRVPEPSFLSAVNNVVKLLRSFQSERQLFPKLWKEMSTEVLHITRDQMESVKLKVLESCSKGEYVSSNDVLSGLIWTTVCHLRNRPLPGSKVESSEDASRLSLAVDLRKNGLDHCVPESYFGNASWFLNISGCKAKRPHDHNPFLKLIHEEKVDKFGDAVTLAARRIRHGLLQFRSKRKVALDLMRNLCSKHTASWSSKVMMLTDHMLKCDVLLTSWQFPLWDVDFGCGTPNAFHGFLHNAPPFSCILIPGPDSHKDYYVAFTVPKSSVDSLKTSPVLQQLVPEAQFVC